MKTNGRKPAAEPGFATEEAPGQGRAAKSKVFMEKAAERYAPA
jgi:hypothetical protein